MVPLDTFSCMSLAARRSKKVSDHALVISNLDEGAVDALALLALVFEKDG